MPNDRERRRCQGTVHEVIDRVLTLQERYRPIPWDIEGDAVRMTDNLRAILRDGPWCRACRMVGTVVYRERQRESYPQSQRRRRKHMDWTLAFYCIDADGQEVQLTRDHIRPRLLGGSDRGHNIQVLCKRCNEQKGCKMPEEG